MQIEIDGITIEVERKRIKNVNLRVYPPDGLVKMSVPYGYKQETIVAHVQEKMSWINFHRERIQRTSIVEEKTLHTGSVISFIGESFLLIVHEQNGPSQFVIDDQLIHCYVKPDTSPEQISLLLDRWYKKQLEALLPDLLERWQPKMHVRVREWGVKKMKTRWGSCNSHERRIWLNLNLMKKPLICLEYVLVHELVHILEPSHSKRFYRLMDQFMPKWRDYEYVLEGKR